MIIAVDLDGVLCKDMHANFREAKPIQEAVDVVNRLYDEGHTIMIWSARGRKENDDKAIDDTIKQLAEWGVKYHEINRNKPFYDLAIDDKAFQSMLSFKKAYEKMRGEQWEK